MYTSSEERISDQTQVTSNFHLIVPCKDLFSANMSFVNTNITCTYLILLLLAGAQDSCSISLL
jgi:hypothetical protein